MVTHLTATVSIAVTHLAAAASSSSKAKKTTSSSGGVEELIFIGLIVLAAWLLFFRPRSRQAQNQRQLLSTLVVGDEILTGAGIYGTVLDVYPDRITIETAPGTRMTVARSTVSRKVEPNSAAPETPHEDGTDHAQNNGYAGSVTLAGTEAADDDVYDEDDADADDQYADDDEVYDEDDDEVYDEDDDAYDDEGEDEEDMNDEADETDGVAGQKEGGTDVQSAGGEGRGR